VTDKSHFAKAFKGLYDFHTDSLHTQTTSKVL